MLIISGLWKGKIHIHILKDDKLVPLVQHLGHNQKVTSLSTIIYQENLLIISGSHDGKIHVYQLKNNKLVLLAQCHAINKPVELLNTKIDEKGNLIIISIYKDNRVRVWKLLSLIFNNSDNISYEQALKIMKELHD